MWTTVSRNSVTDANILQIAWDFNVKRFPDGILRKFSAKFCARGDIQVEVVYYLEKYAPLVSCNTFRLILSLSINQDWATRQVDFSNAFVQVILVDDVYLALPYCVDSENFEGRAKMVMKLNNSLYVLVQSPL